MLTYTDAKLCSPRILEPSNASAKRIRLDDAKEPPTKRASPAAKSKQPQELVHDAPLHRSSSSQATRSFPCSERSSAESSVEWPPELLARALELGALPPKVAQRADRAESETLTNLHLSTGL